MKYPADLPSKFNLMITHPDCRYLANSGVRWLFDYKGESLESWEVFGLTGYSGKNFKKVNIKRFIEMHKAAEFFSKMLLADIEYIAVENPIQHGYADQSILMRMPFEKIKYAQYDQIIQPWMFGHGETKATCLWLKGLPKLTPTHIVDGRNPRVHFESPGPNRWKNRSRTLKGIANAMADQWG
jgi:hypothetical protein